MAKLTCVRHNRRVQVIDIGTAENSIPLTVHRSVGKRNDVCDSNTLVIDGEFFKPSRVIADDWSDDSESNSDKAKREFVWVGGESEGYYA